MKVIIDTNVLISALIKDSLTRNLIIDSGLDFYYPKASFQELEKYRSLILDKSGMDENEYYEVLSRLMSYIRIISNEKIFEHLEEANEIMFNIDFKDIIFIATALSVRSSIIWSDDKHFKQQSKIKVYNTGEMKGFIGNESV